MHVLKKIADSPNMAFHHFVCDDESDLSEINVSKSPMGSTCYVINAKSKYILNGSKKWVVCADASISGGGSGDGSGENDDESGDTVIVYDGGSASE